MNSIVFPGFLFLKCPFNFQICLASLYRCGKYRTVFELLSIYWIYENMPKSSGKRRRLIRFTEGVKWPRNHDFSTDQFFHQVATAIKSRIRWKIICRECKARKKM